MDSEMVENFRMIENDRHMLRQKGTENLHDEMTKGNPAMAKTTKETLSMSESSAVNTTDPPIRKNS